ncbi:MAG: SH3 domain-containing protein, partial [Cyanobacteria bacterium P01_D01_bin.6]
MKSLSLWSVSLGTLSSMALMPAAIADTDDALFLAYPPVGHQTVSDRIFLIGTGDPDQPVLVNGEPIEYRSASGHFAPTVPLELGENTFTLTQGEDILTLAITRVSATPTVLADSWFVPESLAPQVDIARPAGELVCFGVQAIRDADIAVNWANQVIPLAPPPTAVTLPPNYAVLTSQNEPVPLTATPYEGCTTLPATGNLGQPTYVLHGSAPQSATAPGTISRLTTTDYQVAEVIVASGIARTGPSTNYSRITPLPRGTRAAITATEGDWLRLDYGGWIRASETAITAATAPPRSIMRSVTSEQIPGWTEVRFPLQTPVPIAIDQTADTLTLTLHNTTPQTDTIYFDVDPVVQRLDWQPVLPDRAQFRFQFRTDQQWGYKVRYEGTTLVLSLKHPPNLSNDSLA